MLSTTATEEQIEAAKEVVKKLRFQFSGESFENPVLQNHWRNIEALALDREEPDELIDYASQCSLLCFVCMYMRERVCVCVREKICVYERERDFVCMCVCETLCVCEKVCVMSACSAVI